MKLNKYDLILLLYFLEDYIDSHYDDDVHTNCYLTIILDKIFDILSEMEVD